MSILPFLLEDLARPTVYDQYHDLLEDLARPTVYDQYHGLLDDDLVLHPRRSHHRKNRSPSLMLFQRPCRRRPSSASQGLSHIQNDKNNFKVNLDVQQFKPDEVSVKVVDGYVVIDGKHEERTDEHGYISRQFTRRYKVPDNVDADSIISTLSSDGVLSIGAPTKVPENTTGERPIPIIQTNQPSIKQSQSEEKESNEKMEVNQ